MSCSTTVTDVIKAEVNFGLIFVTISGKGAIKGVTSYTTLKLIACTIIFVIPLRIV